MADGTTKAISQIQPGDAVTATDPKTGQTAGRTVTAVHKNQDTDLADLTVRNATGRLSTIHTTQDHLFWDQTYGTWVPAGALKPGNRLYTQDGASLIVFIVRPFVAGQSMYNLSVGGVHTYYVAVGSAAVLVHNEDDTPSMLGAKGTQTTSKTLWTRGQYRIDVENPNPGQRPGQLHVQDQSNGAKYLYNFDTGEFEGMPQKLRKEAAKMQGFNEAIAKGARYLGIGC